MIRELAASVGHEPDAIEINVIGSKPGEKLYEELMNDEETRRTVELPKYFVVLPAFKSIYEEIDYTYPGAIAQQVDRPYNSSVEPAMTAEELADFLRRNHLMEE